MLLILNYEVVPVGGGPSRSADVVRVLDNVVSGAHDHMWEVHRRRPEVLQSEQRLEVGCRRRHMSPLAGAEARDRTQSEAHAVRNQERRLETDQEQRL